MITDKIKEVVERVAGELGIRYHEYMHTDNMYSVFFYYDEVPEEKVDEIIDRVYQLTNAKPKIVKTIGKIYLDYVVEESYKPCSLLEIRNIYLSYKKLLHRKYVTEEEDVPKPCLENMKPIIIVRRIGNLVEEDYSGYKVAYCEAGKKSYIVVLHEKIAPKPLYEILSWDKDKTMPELKQLSKII